MIISGFLLLVDSNTRRETAKGNQAATVGTDDPCTPPGEVLDLPL